MKQRKLSRKLFLNKKTIANLDTLSDIKGGTPGTAETCLRVPGGSNCLACYEPPGDPPNNTADCDTAYCWTEDPEATCVPCTFPTLCIQNCP